MVSAHHEPPDPGAAVDALNTLRAILVGITFVITLMLAADGQIIPAAVLAVGIAAHVALWRYLRAEKARTAEADPLAELR